MFADSIDGFFICGTHFPFLLSSFRAVVTESPGHGEWLPEDTNSGPLCSGSLAPEGLAHCVAHRCSVNTR